MPAYGHLKVSEPSSNTQGTPRTDKPTQKYQWEAEENGHDSHAKCEIQKISNGGQHNILV